ncbi:ABC transporter ATP-binding protein [Bacillus sp. JJ1503]|uniref:ABC transporter ATP-binding protein n=1 Tax=Bacillus sp. JJ1503 TaxID=3122956 RepID=UPI002FFFFFC2
MEIENVSKLYKDFKALDNVSLNIKKGEFMTILGPSGSGKTTLLKLIAGFEKINKGIILINSQDISKKKSYERNIGMVFQNYALFPHMTVYNNVAYPLKNRKINKAKIKEMVDRILELVDLKEYSERYPSQLSGGQQQRVALARAIVFKPPFILLDEPLSALDKNLRNHMQIEMKRIHDYVGATTLAVTHDQEEALTMSDRICVMKDGKILQVDTPVNLYKFPNNRFVATFLGENNLINGQLLEINEQMARVKIRDNLIVKAKVTQSFLDQMKKDKKDEVFIAIRPENIDLCKEDFHENNSIEVQVVKKTYLGDAIKIDTDFQGNLLSLKLPVKKGEFLLEGKRALIGWKKNDAILIH